jgi:nicotinamide-nucleotide amidase
MGLSYNFLKYALKRSKININLKIIRVIFMSIKSLVNEIGALCKTHKLTLVTAESCTGGGIAYAFLQSSCMSGILERGYITYSNQAKEDLIKVKTRSLLLNGAVSEIVAREMAEGALKNSLAQVSIAVTGLAADKENSSNAISVAWIAISIVNYPTHVKKFIYSRHPEKFIDILIENSLVFLNKTIKSTLK